jgi:hypothetical protein
MKIEIKNRFNNKIILCGEYESIKDCLQKNSGADLRGANLRGADLYYANLRGANLRGADLCGANLRGANLCGANLRDANLCDADLRDADLRDADLRGADLCDADLYYADLCDANLYGANVRDANLYYADLRGADFDKNTVPIISILGSKHHVYYFKNILRIGCYSKTIEEWEKEYKIIGEDEKYSEQEIKEYYNYIIAIKNIIDKEKADWHG